MNDVSELHLPLRRLGRGERAARFVAVASGAFLIFVLAFVAGLWFQEKQPWPHRYVYDALSTMVRTVKQGRLLPKNVLVIPLGQASRRAFAVEPRVRLIPGHRIVMGYLPELDAYGIRSVDAGGRVEHLWRLDYASIDPDGPSNGNGAPHAMHMFRDGSVVVNFDHGDAMARFDACGRVIWKRSGHFHHAFSPADDGSLWTWRGDTGSEDQYQYLVRFDPRTGRTLQEIGLVEDILSTPAARTIFGIPRGLALERRRPGKEVADLFHPNDVEVLTAALALAFPGFEAGDLLASFRNINLVAVIDPLTRTVKWRAYGPWVRQHDPDFDTDGRISVFNNNSGGGISNVLSIRPATGEVTETPLPPGGRFYSDTMGKHSRTPDGRLVVVNPANGQVQEFASDGRLLLTLHNRYSDRFNAYVSDAIWLPPDGLDVSAWTRCGR